MKQTKPTNLWWKNKWNSIKSKYFFVFAFLFLVNFSVLNAQLRFPNSSFEDSATASLGSKYYIPQWLGCEMNTINAYPHPPKPWYSTPDLISGQSFQPIPHGNYCLGLVSFLCLIPNDEAKDGERMSSKLVCNSLLKFYKYNFSIFFYSIMGYSIPPGCLEIYLGHDYCDTIPSHKYFEYHTLEKDVWQKLDINIIPDENFKYMMIRNNFCFNTTKIPNWIDSLITQSGFQIDNLSPIYSDTAYNSALTPIQLSKEPACVGDEILLQSPVSEYPDQQVWLKNGKEIGRGTSVKDTILGTANYMLLVGEDSCNALVLTRTIQPIACKPDGNVFVLPSAFTPNGDHLNDGFGVVAMRHAIEVKEFYLLIYNRYGQVVKKIFKPSEQWTGEGFDIGSYYYLILATDKNGFKYKQKGNVELIK